MNAVAPVGHTDLAPITNVLPADEVGPAALPRSAAAGSFSAAFTEQLSQVNQQLLVSETDLQSLASGNVQDLHQVMIRLEESRLSFQLMMQVRGRLLEAYQDIMKMQV